MEMHIPEYLRYDSFLNNLKDARMIWNYSYTKKGMLCIVLNDGDPDKRDIACADRRNHVNRMEYEAGCTKIFSPLPSELSKLDTSEITIEKWKKLARSDDLEHYAWKGKIRPIPDRSGKPNAV